ncbi:MAG: hypothetical protein Q9200_007674 [Gallowayella weberi]
MAQRHQVVIVSRADVNRTPLAHELRAAAKLHDRQWTERNDFKGLPFLTTCLVIGCAFQPEAPNWVSLDLWKFPFALGSPETGIDLTIIDISDSESLKYCFAKKNSGLGSRLWDTLSAGQYFAWKTRRQYRGIPNVLHVNPSDGQGFDSQVDDREMVKRLTYYELFRDAAFHSLLTQYPVAMEQVEIHRTDHQIYLKALYQMANDAFFGFAIKGLD